MTRAYLALAALSLAAVASAEVRVDVDSSGAVTAAPVETDSSRRIVWGRLSAVAENQLLNPEGDKLRDTPPAIGVLALPADDPMNKGITARGSGAFLSVTPRRRLSPGPAGSRGLVTPVAIWSRWDGEDRELVYSLWDYRSETWRDAAFLERIDNLLDDDAPTVLVRGERAYLLWRRGQLLLVSIGSLYGSNGSYDVSWSTPNVVGYVDTTPIADVLRRVVTAAEAPVRRIPGS